MWEVSVSQLAAAKRQCLREVSWQTNFTWREMNKKITKSPGDTFFHMIAAWRCFFSVDCKLHWRDLPRSVGPGLLRCVSAAPRSFAGEVNLSPDDGQELPELQLCGRAGSTSTDRSFVGLWPRLSYYQAKVKDEGEGGSPSEGNFGDGGPSFAFGEKCTGPCGCREHWEKWLNVTDADLSVVS